jgi:hypothetical protein
MSLPGYQSRIPDELALEDLGGRQVASGICLAAGEQWVFISWWAPGDERKMRKGEGGTFSSGEGSSAAGKCKRTASRSPVVLAVDST